MKKVFYLSFCALFWGAAVAAALSTWWPAFAATPKEQAIEKALSWLQGQQQNDGGFSTAAVSPYLGTAQGVVSLAAANRDPYIFLSAGNKSPLDYLEGGVDDQTDEVYETHIAAWTTMAVVAAGGNPYGFGGVNLVDRLQDYYDSSTGQYGVPGNVEHQYLSMLALSVAVTESQPITVTVPQTATNLLKSWQQSGGAYDGGWGWQYPCLGAGAGAAGWEVRGAGEACVPNVNDTAMAVMALIAAGELPTSTAVTKGLNFIQSYRTSDGSYRLPWASAGNAHSTALAIQAILAAGQTPADSSYNYLLSVQADAGYFQYNSSSAGPDTVLTTIRAIPALAKKPFPLRGRYTSYKKALRWMKTKQNSDGGFPSVSPWSGDETMYSWTTQGVVAIAAGGEDPGDPNLWGYSGITTPIDYLESNADAETDTYTDTAKLAWTILAALAGDKDPTNFGGVDLIGRLQSYYQIVQDGQYGPAGNNIAQSMAIIALTAAEQAGIPTATVPITAVNTLRDRQGSEGGWCWNHPCSWEYTVDDTALALEALIAYCDPITASHIISGLNFIKNLQGDNGGFADCSGNFCGGENANSTGWGLQAVIAAAQNPQGPDWAKDSYTPWYFGMRLQADVGYFEYSSPPPPWGADIMLTTIQMVPALANKPFPFLGRMTVGEAYGNLNLFSKNYHVYAPFAEDIGSNGRTSNGSAKLSYYDGGSHGPYDMVKGNAGAFAYTFGPLAAGTVYTIEISYNDSDGMKGYPITQTLTATLRNVYLPLILKN